MKAIVRKIELKEYRTKEGRSFNKCNIICDVPKEKGEIKTLKASYNVDYIKKYLQYCNTTTKALLNQNVEVTLSKGSYTSKEGVLKTYEFIKYLNVLDENGKAIIMPSNKKQELDF